MSKETYDVDIYGKSLIVDWKGVVEEREGYEKQEALTQQQIDTKQEEQRQYIRKVNYENREQQIKNNIKPF